MEVKLLSCQNPNVKLNPNIHENALLIVFETTIMGYYQANKFLNENTIKKKLFRLCINYSTTDQDALNPKNGTIKSTIVSYPKDHVFEIKEILDVIEEKTMYAKCLGYLIDQLTLRNAETGLNRLEEFFKDNWNNGPEVIIAMALTYFKIPVPLSQIVKKEMDMFILPIYPHLPHVLLKMQFKKEDVRAMLIKHLNLGHADWDLLVPHMGWKFVISGDIDFLLPNKSFEEMRRDKKLTYIGTAWQPNKFTCVEPYEVEVEWNPIFLGMQFETISNYMHYWIGQHIIKIRVIWNKIKEDEDRDIQERDFARLIYAEKRLMTPPFERYFVDENYETKKMRIMQDFEGNLSLMELPIWKIGKEFALTDNLTQISESPIDLWISLL